MGNTAIPSQLGTTITEVLSKIDTNNHYLTTESWTGKYWIDGKKIYRKTINFGSLPNSSDKYVNHNISNLNNIWVEEDASFCKTNDNSYYPVSLGSSNGNYWVANYTSIRVSTSYDRRDWTAIITLNYTKTTN